MKRPPLTGPVGVTIHVVILVASVCNADGIGRKVVDRSRDIDIIVGPASFVSGRLIFKRLINS